MADYADEINLSADIIDSRDIIARIKDLEAEQTDGAGLTEDEQEELTALRALAEEGEMYAGDWAHGEALIADHYFTAYAQELAEDIGAISPDATWPLNRIDWEAAADDLSVDYSTVSVTLFGSTYTFYVRN